MNDSVASLDRSAASRLGPIRIDGVAADCLVMCHRRAELLLGCGHPGWIRCGSRWQLLVNGQSWSVNGGG
jgi:hypothetical protein